MARLEILLIFVLHFDACIHGTIVYKRLGEDATLPCAGRDNSDKTCWNAAWVYNTDPTLPEVRIDFANRSSSRASRLSLDADCSLFVKNVAAEDVGLYNCGGDDKVYLNLLTISPSPPDADPKKDGVVKLKCSLFRHSALGFCQIGTLPWVDETGAVLLDEGVGYNFQVQQKCVSSLTVKRQSGYNRRYTCRFDQHGVTKVKADYTPDFLGQSENQMGTSNPDDFTDWSQSKVMWAVRIAGLIVIFVVTVLFIGYICNTKRCGNDNNVNDDEKILYENARVCLAASRLP